MSDPLPPPGKFENMAMSLSGGGVRALGFHLGTLDVLHRLGMLDNVKSLASASGGSMAALGYALWSKGQRVAQPGDQSGGGFGDFIRDFFEFIPQLDTMGRLVEGINTPGPGGNRTTVGAMARTYRDAYFLPYFNNPKMEVLTHAGDPNDHLDNVIINVANYKTALTFRFRYRRNPLSGGQLRSGGDQVHLEHDEAKEVLVADVMTASACLPGLLEPLFMPNDFTFDGPNNGDDKRQDIRAYFNNECDVEFDYVALMDGGILDNQGILSILITLAGLDTPQPSSSSSAWDIAWERRLRHRRPQFQQTAESVVSEDPVLADPPEEPPIESPQDPPQAPSADTDLSPIDQALSSVDLFVVSDTPEYRTREGRYFPKEEDILLSSPTHFGFIKRLFLNRKLRFYVFLVLALATMGAIGVGMAYWGLLTTAFSGPDGPIQNLVNAFAGSGFNASLSWGLAALILLGLPVLAVTVVILLFILFKARGLEAQVEAYFPKQRDRVLGWRRSIWSYVRDIRVGDLIFMVHLRISSLLRTLSEIFPHRVRFLSYYSLLERVGMEHRVLPVEIFKLWDLALAEGNNATVTPHGQGHELPAFMSDYMANAEIMSLVEQSATMKTKLFADKDELRDLMITGQLTTCYCLMEYLWQHHGDGDPNPFPAAPAPSVARDLFEATQALWTQLMNDRTSLVNPYLT